MSEQKSRKQSVIKKIRGFIDRAYKDHIPAYAASASFFLLMAFIPFVMFLTTLIRYTPVTYNMMREMIVEALPQSIQEFVLEVVSDVYRRNAVLIPITGVTALWSAGKGVQAVTNGLNNIYHVKEPRNWLVTAENYRRSLRATVRSRVRSSDRSSMPGHCWHFRCCFLCSFFCIKFFRTVSRLSEARLPVRLSFRLPG